MAINIAILIGRLTADPELKTTPSGTSVTSFSIAVDRRYKSGEDRQTDFINIVAWRQTAEFICKYFGKGSMICIEGSIQTRRYQDKDGNSRTAFEVVANNVTFVESKKTSEPTNVATAQVLKNNDDALSQFISDNSDLISVEADEDLPF